MDKTRLNSFHFHSTKPERIVELPQVQPSLAVQQ